MRINALSFLAVMLVVAAGATAAHANLPGSPSQAMVKENPLIIEGMNNLMFRLNGGDLILLKEGDPDKPDEWNTEVGNWCGLVRYYEQTVENQTSAHALFILSRATGFDKADIPERGGFPAGDVAENKHFILKLKDQLVTPYNTTGPGDSRANYSISCESCVATRAAAPEPGSGSLYAAAITLLSAGLLLRRRISIS